MTKGYAPRKKRIVKTERVKASSVTHGGKPYFCGSPHLGQTAEITKSEKIKRRR